MILAASTVAIVAIAAVIIVALLALIMLTGLHAFNIERRWARPALMVALALLVLGGGVSAYARVAEPAAASR